MRLREAITAAVLACATLAGCGRPGVPQEPSSQGPAVCAKCGRPVLPGHDCQAVDRCATCEREVRRGHVCGETSICRASDPTHPECVFEVGHEHIHGVTHRCPFCRQEVAENHMRNEVGRCLTQFCRGCETDVVRPDYAEGLLREKVLHVCGVTHFCPKCMTEVADNHICDVTRYCATCRRDVSFPFCAECRTVLGETREESRLLLERLHPVDAKGNPLDPGPILVHCEKCKKDVRVLDHVCFETEFCPRCRREMPLEHSDEE